MNWIAILLALLVLGVLGLVFGAVLGVADKKFYVKVDERVKKVRECLGGANCGACGFAGCDAFAEAVVAGEAQPNGCPAGGAKTAEAIGEIMGLSVETSAPVVARVLCNGTIGRAKERYEYDGYQSCRVAAGLAGGPKLCRFSCIGFGDCADKCNFNAITMVDGIAHIDEDHCVGCGACVKECPRNAIALLPKDAKHYVLCRNSDTGRDARAACMSACIACQRCVKTCQHDAIKVENGYAAIDYDKCTRCGDCAAVCPCKCITIKE